MATSSPRANTSPKSWFLPSFHPQPNPSREDLCPLLGPEPPPHRPSHPATASALAQQGQSLLSGTIALCWVIQCVSYLVELPGLLTAQPRASGKGKKITTVAGKSTPASHLSPKHWLTLPGEGPSPWMEQVPLLSPAQSSSSVGGRGGGSPSPHQHQGRSGLSQHQNLPQLLAFGRNTTVPSHPISSFLAWPCSSFLSMPNAVFALFCQKSILAPSCRPGGSSSCDSQALP